jgi:hypothetical protein
MARLGVHVLVPLWCGGALYLFLRPTAAGVFDWLRHAGLSGTVLAVRELVAPGRGYLPGWFVYSLPDGLWCYATTAASTLLWADVIGRTGLRMLIANSGLAAGCGIELLQHVGLLDGTSDPMDVALACIGSIAAGCAIDGTRCEDPRGLARSGARLRPPTSAGDFEDHGCARWSGEAIR